MKIQLCAVIVCLTLGHVSSFPHGAPGTSCIREPTGHGAPKKAGDNGFRVRVESDPDTYIPNEVYTVSLTSTNPTAYLGFMLVALQASNEYEAAGNFELIDYNISRFTENCPFALTHTSSLPKMSVSFTWTAPPRNTGCVNFRATVVQHKQVWFKDDGALTLTLCEAAEDYIPESFQREITDCCACGSAKYRVTFIGQWTRSTHTKDYPAGHGNHWSSLTGCSHSKDYIVFEYGGYASEGIRRVAEWGSSSVLEQEMKSQGQNIRTVIRRPGLWPAIGNMSSLFSADQERHLLTVLTMLGPSPDWCAGVSAVDLCTQDCGWVNRLELALYPWDAGTDSGITYMSANSQTVPQEKIRPLSSSYPNNPASPFYDITGRPIKRVATLIIELMDTKGDQCLKDGVEEEVNIVYENDYNLQFSVDDNSTPPPRVEQHMGAKKRPKGKKPMPPFIEQPKKDMESLPTMMPKKDMPLPTMMPKKEMPQPPIEDEVMEVTPMMKKFPPEMPDKDMPIDCMMSEWQEWSECTKTCGKHGKTIRTRMIKVRPANGGRKCGRKKQKQKCNTDIRCPVDCTLGEWGSWSACVNSCQQDGLQVRMRPVVKRAKHGGKECDETEQQRVLQ
ncbi:F-spondin-like protein precursor [Saccoglossus kowalevskii]|uniref:Spondin-1 n=1 Tax=Saccoglossus kowalevskii TaxID=10224 RepID=D1LX04_SACKO|nr:F-spondin-like protein precursor [Saccoglossus kowalevskii]ACY92510.1 F-spondin-like protein [Saccoglossus kowalevskii]